MSYSDGLKKAFENDLKNAVERAKIENEKVPKRKLKKAAIACIEAETSYVALYVPQVGAFIIRNSHMRKLEYMAASDDPNERFGAVLQISDLRLNAPELEDWALTLLLKLSFDQNEEVRKMARSMLNATKSFAWRALETLNEEKKT